MKILNLDILDGPPIEVVINDADIYRIQRFMEDVTKLFNSDSTTAPKATEPAPSSCDKDFDPHDCSARAGNPIDAVSQRGVAGPLVDGLVAVAPELLKPFAEQRRKDIAEHVAEINSKNWQRGVAGEVGLGEFVLMPRRLTAENGAKAQMMGEYETQDKHGNAVVVSWTAIKEIYAGSVDFLAASPAKAPEAVPLSKGHKCEADMYADSPRDCNFPFCSCDPGAEAAVNSLAELNLLLERAQYPLSDSALEQLAIDEAFDRYDRNTYFRVARAIEAAHGITPATTGEKG